jgi:glycosyltransferase involved in cell wall biosynthesis
MPRLLVSVVMPAYNAAKYIEEAIESILAQTLKEFELIVVDDGSTDNTREIIEGYARRDPRVRLLVNETNLKLCRTANRGIEAATAPLIARMDADDWSYPNRLELQVRFMSEHPEVVISGGSMDVCDEKLQVINQRHYPLTDKDIRKVMMRYSPFSHPTVIYRTEAIRKAGSYNPQLPFAEDYDMYFRIGRFGKFGNLPQILVKYRSSSSSYFHSKIRQQERATIYTRLKAVEEYGYKMNLVDRMVLALHWLSLYVIPSRLKYALFIRLRQWLHN